jgi:hypothetical protein
MARYKRAGGTQFMIADSTLYPQLAPSLKAIPGVEQISADMDAILQIVDDELLTLATMHDVSVTWVDQDGFFRQLIDDPSPFGLANVTESVMDVPGGSPDEYLWWDGFHWTTKGHRIVADFTLRAVLGSDVSTACDLDADGRCGLTDIDRLATAIAERTDLIAFDLTADGVVDQSDLDQFLNEVTRFNGDANFDGEVTFDDFLPLSANYGQDDNTWSEGDFVPNGTVDFEDFLVLAANVGRSSLNVAASVPEPSVSTVLVCLSVAGVGVARRSFSRKSASYRPR